ncbi:hypothetical protein LCGC14_1009220 [marine sediment metagenome]|uniref:Uncharacterized protein n=1 Tax=marine sediment metagenome TaxID=412755 RepID=A0A0F9R6V1_9ZZZZ
MAKITILEGPDGGGKTRLAYRLCDRYGFRYHHEGPPHQPDMFRYYAETLERMVYSRTNWVLDRFHLGELVYGEVVRGKSQIGTEGVRLLNRLIRHADVRVVIVLPDPITCEKNFQKELDEGRGYLKTRRQFTRVYNFYHDLWRQSCGHYLRFNYRNRLHNLDHLVTPYRHTPFRGMVGSRRAKFIIMGEQVNHEKISVDLPFFNLENSSHSLNRALWAAGYLEEEMAFVNAYRGTKPKNLRRLIRESQPKAERIIALDGRAQYVLATQGVPHYRVAHPQFIKRFEHPKSQRYVRQLKDIREANQSYANRYLYKV